MDEVAEKIKQGTGRESIETYELPFTLRAEYINKLLEDLWEEGSISSALEIFYSLSDELTRSHARGFFLNGMRFEDNNGVFLLRYTESRLTPGQAILEAKLKEATEVSDRISNSAKVSEAFLVIAPTIGYTLNMKPYIKKEMTSIEVKPLVAALTTIIADVMALSELMQNKANVIRQLNEVIKRKERDDTQDTDGYTQASYDEQLEEDAPVKYIGLEDGWISEDGKLYNCPYGWHEALLEDLAKSGVINTSDVKIIEKRWVRVSNGQFWYMGSNLTQKQIDTIFDLTTRWKVRNTAFNGIRLKTSELIDYISKEVNNDRT